MEAAEPGMSPEQILSTKVYRDIIRAVVMGLTSGEKPIPAEAQDRIARTTISLIRAFAVAYCFLPESAIDDCIALLSKQMKDFYLIYHQASEAYLLMQKGDIEEAMERMSK